MEDMNNVFDVENRPIVFDNSKIDKSLDDMNNQMFEELFSFKEMNLIPQTNAEGEIVENQQFSMLENFAKLLEDKANEHKDQDDSVPVDEITQNVDNIDSSPTNNPNMSTQLLYKQQLEKALKLISSLKQELDEYKKMGRLAKYLKDTSKMNPELFKEIVTEDIKLIISDLREQIDEKETNEMSIIHDNIKNLVQLMDKQQGRDLENLLEKLLQSKLSKQEVFKDFTDKIITTIEEVEEGNENESADDSYDEIDDDPEDDRMSNKNSLLTPSRRMNTPTNEYLGIKRKIKQGTYIRGGSALDVATLVKTHRKFKHTALGLMDKLRKKKYLRDFMPKSQLFVTITQIYKTARDYIEKSHPELPFYCYVYDYFMNKYGIKKIADKKFRQM